MVGDWGTCPNYSYTDTTISSNTVDSTDVTCVEWSFAGEDGTAEISSEVSLIVICPEEPEEESPPKVCPETPRKVQPKRSRHPVIHSPPGGWFLFKG